MPDVIVRGNAAGFAQTIEVGSHRLAADEPLAFGGTDMGLSPYDLLLAALGTCTSMTIGLYARRRGWPLEEVTVSLRHAKIYAADCAECETKEGKIERGNSVPSYWKWWTSALFIGRLLPRSTSRLKQSKREKAVRISNCGMFLQNETLATLRIVQATS